MIGEIKKGLSSKAAKDINDDEYAFYARNLAPAYYLKDMSFAGNANVPKADPEDLAESTVVRFADGGYGDNTSTGHMLRYLQDAEEIDNFEVFIVAHDDSPSAGTQFGGYSDDIAQVFGYQVSDGTTQECSGSGSKQVCIPTTQAQVFEQSAVDGVEPAWQQTIDGIPLTYGKYQATTVDNAALGIAGGATGTVHVFQSVSNVGDIPTDGTTFKDYENLMNAIVTGITQETDGAWPYVAAAMGAPTS